MRMLNILSHQGMRIMISNRLFLAFTGLITILGMNLQAMQSQSEIELKQDAAKVSCVMHPKTDSLTPKVDSTIPQIPQKSTIVPSQEVELATKVQSLRSVQSARLQNISSESIFTLYYWYGPKTIYIPKKVLGDVAAFKDFFEKASKEGLIQLPPKYSAQGSEKAWLRAFKIFNEELADTAENDPCVLHYDKLRGLLNDANSILKSYLPAHEDDIRCFQEHCIKKTDLRRLLTYAQLQRVINKKGLSHVRLPLKILVIKDRKTGNYITGEAALKILDGIVNIHLASIGVGMCLDIAYYGRDDYEFFILAHKQIHGKVPLSKIALEQLAELIKEAPFDLGYDNIFSDSDGDAVIIDTEFKGEPSFHSLPKLQRYNDIKASLDLFIDESHLF